MSDQTDATMADIHTQYLKVQDSVSGDDRQIAYKSSEGEAGITVLFIGGFMSTKDNTKPTAIHAFARKHGYTFIRYDATALGESKGSVALGDARLTHWLQDAEEVLTRLTQGPLMLIGSSMGGWIASILTKKYSERVRGLVLLAPSINFSDHYVEKIRKMAPPELLSVLEEGGSFEHQDPKYGPYPLSLRVFQEMKPYELPLAEEGGYPIECPVRLLHGTEDTYSPYMTSLKVLQGFTTSDIQVTFLKGTGHHLDDPAALDAICHLLLTTLKALQCKL